MERSEKPEPASPLTKPHASFSEVACPIHGQDAVSHIAMKRRMRPIAHARNKAVSDRIEVNVVDVPFKIAFVADRVLAETALPERMLAIRVAWDADTSLLDALVKRRLIKLSRLA